MLSDTFDEPVDKDHRFDSICKEDLNTERQATRINEAISAEETLSGKLIRVVRPQS